MSTSGYIEGLKAARKFFELHDGLACLNALIAEHEADQIETTAVQPITETR